MKIYSKVVISLETEEVLEEESFEYFGPVAQCGKSGGGGGGSGKMDWPQYLKDAHEQGLDKVWEVRGGTFNPYNDVDVFSYDPAAPLGAIDSDLADFNSMVVGYGTLALDPKANWESLIDTVTNKFEDVVFDQSTIDAEIASFGDLLSADITSDALPRFRAGMRTVNAVQSSAFVIGEANIEAERVRSLAKYGTELNLKYMFNPQRIQAITGTVQELMQMQTHTIDKYKDLLHYQIEGNRMKIVANKEHQDTSNELAKLRGKWDFEELQYYANMISAISGGVMSAGDERPSGMQSALGGALSGASAGYMLGGPWGAAAGGAIGLAGSLF